MRPTFLLLGLAIGLALPTNALPLLAAQRRQLLNLLTLDFGPAGPVYTSGGRDNITCEAASFSFNGVNPPFRLDVVKAPVGASAAWEEQVVLEPLGNFTQGAKMEWNVTLPVNTTFALRIADAVGNVRYSTVKTVEEGNAKGASCTGPTRHSGVGELIPLLIVLIGGGVALSVWLVVSVNRWHRRIAQRRVEVVVRRPPRVAFGQDIPLQEVVAAPAEAERPPSTASEASSLRSSSSSWVTSVRSGSSSGTAPPPRYEEATAEQTK